MKHTRLNPRRFALATLASGVAMWLLAGLWHLVIVPSFYSTHGGVEHHEGGWMISVGYLLLAVVMAYMYPSLSRGGRPIREGLKLGLMVGFLWVTPHALVRAGAHDGSLTYIAINGAWHLVEQAVGGAIIGLVYGARLAATRKAVSLWHKAR